MLINNKNAVILLMVIMALLQFGCASEKPKTDTVEVKKEESHWKKTKAYISDADITAAIKLKFINDDYIHVLDIRVETQNGVVTLLGHVQRQADIERALLLVKTTDGVVDVVNKLVIIFG